MACSPLILGQFMADYAFRPWRWSHVDCCMAIAALSIAYGTDDPAADLHDTYSTEDECHAVMEAAGGLIPFGDRLVRVGWRVAETPSEGCVAVIGSLTSATRQWAAIRHEGKWKVRMDEGWIVFTARPLILWEF
ncbi:DUF6950 family protein [Mesorhizobium sp. IMUNJ 23232]|uniref:DUF6950 family protein n=1 Tax=Mesorhizobium sp. IMUNJ 23232 TaxID=3376064 RepID=UPI0037ADA1C4